MRAIDQLRLAAVLVLAGACAPPGIGDDGWSECPSNALCAVVACVPPCVSVVLSVDETWRGPELPPRRNSFIGGISCMLPDEPQAEYPTRLDIAPEAGTIDFECDGELGLHLVGHLTQVGLTRDRPEQGSFGRDSTVVLSATGTMGEWLAGVMDVRGTDLLPIATPPYGGWARGDELGYLDGGASGYLFAGPDRQEPSGGAGFEFSFNFPHEAVPAAPDAPPP